MNPLALFKQQQPLEEVKPQGGGEDTIRKALFVRIRKKENLINLSRDLQVPQDALLKFCDGERNFNEEALQVICKFLWTHTSYDEASDKLYSTGPEATSVGVHPVWDRKSYAPAIINRDGTACAGEPLGAASSYRRPPGR